MADNRTDEAAIERDVRRTQDQMGETVDKLEDKLNPRDITRETLGEDRADAAKEALEVARQNPVPIALIAIGVIWLLATSRSPTINRLTDRITGRRRTAKQRDTEFRPRSAEPAPIGSPPAREQASGRRPAEPAPI